MESFKLEKWIESLIYECDLYHLTLQEFVCLEKICKKIDVVRKIYDQYSSDLSKRESDVEVSIESYQKVMHVLLFAAEKKKDYKFINTAFKLNDILLEHSNISAEGYSANYEVLIELMESI